MKIFRSYVEEEVWDLAKAAMTSGGEHSFLKCKGLYGMSKRHLTPIHMPDGGSLCNEDAGRSQRSWTQGSSNT